MKFFVFGFLYFLICVFFLKIVCFFVVVVLMVLYFFLCLRVSCFYGCFMFIIDRRIFGVRMLRSLGWRDGLVKGWWGLGGIICCLMLGCGFVWGSSLCCCRLGMLWLGCVRSFWRLSWRVSWGSGRKICCWLFCIVRVWWCYWSWGSSSWGW